jgi:signal transduction histidine kinase
MSYKYVLTSLHPEDRRRVDEGVKRALAKKIDYDMEYRALLPDGRVRWVLSKGRPFYDENERPVRLVGTVMDITERKKAVDALRTAREKLAQANEALEDKVAERTLKLKDAVAELEHFSYTITHDMRAPLRAMKAFAEILLEEAPDKLDPEHQEYLRRIMSSSLRMDHLIEDALNYSKIAREEFVLVPVDVDRLVHDMINSYPSFHLPAADVSIDGPLGRVLGTESGLTQCFSNLLNNAVKFVRPNQLPVVRIRSETRDEFIRFWVEDNGIGIPSEYQKKIFGMFQRLNNDYEGTGIGLALVAKVVDRICGRMGVESAENQGSRFWLEFKSCNDCPADYSISAEKACANSNESTGS